MFKLCIITILHSVLVSKLGHQDLLWSEGVGSWSRDWGWMVGWVGVVEWCKNCVGLLVLIGEVAYKISDH